MTRIGGASTFKDAPDGAQTSRAVVPADVGVAITTALLAMLFANDPVARAPDLWGYLLILAACTPLLFRRRWPRTASGVVAIPALTFMANGYAAGSATVVVLVALYGAAAVGCRRWAIGWAALFCGGGLAWRTLVAADPLIEIVIHSALFVLAIMLGDAMHSRRTSAATTQEPVAESDAREAAQTERLLQIIRARHFHPVFQPIYALNDGCLVAVEALTRFDSEPARPPDVWFAEAARLGIGPELELAAIHEALAASEKLSAGIAVSVNVSPETLLDPRLMALLDDHRDRSLIVELTEHAIVDDYHLMDATREELRRRGVRFAVDDAGAGFASMHHVVRLEPEIIKLDASLAQNIRRDPSRHALAVALIHFSREAHCQLVAEGIEEMADLLAWRRLGAHAAQGYLLARPGPLPVRERFDLPDQAA